jgi:serine/threonine protein phosphatase PrpC
MAELVVTVGCRSVTGRRPNNEDRFVADPSNKLFVVADGMGGQECGERATAVVAIQQDNLVYVAGLGDSRAYLVRGGRVEQLTVDHTVADALERNGALTPEQAAVSPWKHVLYKFLGCVEMSEGAEVHPFTPQPGDRLVLASDGLTNHVSAGDLIEGAATYNHPQTWADHLVDLALERGSRDNVTCVIVAFNYESIDSKVLPRVTS